MAWPDEIVSGLPSPRKDEPEDLRRAIEDELADHLACALERERGAAGEGECVDEEAARRAVLARFGNPKLVAYQLWWDAMKEKIMKDRLMIAASALLMLTCFAALGALWFTLKESRAVNAALLAQLKELVSRPAPATAPAVAGNMALLKIKTVGADGKPISGISFALHGAAFTDKNQDDNLTIETNAQGEGNVGPIRAGQYVLACGSEEYSPYNYRYDKYVVLFGGQTQEMKVTCPDDLRSTPTAVRLQVKLPRELAAAMDPQTYSNKLRYYLGGYLVGEPRGMTLDGTEWRKKEAPFLIDAQGNITSRYGLEMNGAPRVATGFSLNQQPEFKPALPIAPGRYRMQHMFVGLYSLTKNGNSWVQEQKVPAYLEFPDGKGSLIDIPDKAETSITLAMPEVLLKSLRETFIEQTAILCVKDWYHFRDTNFTPEFFGTTTEHPETLTLVKIKSVQDGPESKELNLKQGQSGTVGNIEVTVLEMLHEGGIRCRCRFRFVPHPLAVSPSTNPASITTQTQAAGGGY